MKFVITIDTEADDQWKQDGEVTLHNLDDLPRFQDFSQKLGITPTYLVSHETLKHPTLRMLGDAHREGKAEVGGHLHPWTTPPYSALDVTVQRFPLELSDDELEAKMHSLTSSITELLGDAPLSFRAGRWGANKRVLQSVARHGYRFDSSVTPGINWRTLVKDREKHQDIPDFSASDVRPYLVPGTELLEIPMSVVATGVADLRALERSSSSLVRRVGRGLARRRWCRIFPETTLGDLISVYHAAQRQNLPALIYMTHSSELSAGRSPYAKDAAAVERTYDLLERFWAFLAVQGVESARLRDVGLPVGE